MREQVCGGYFPSCSRAETHELPAAAAVCGNAYRRYALARRASGGGDAPKMPLPDFFIGAHAEIMEWKLAPRDVDQIAKCFPAADLLTP